MRTVNSPKQYENTDSYDKILLNQKPYQNLTVIQFSENNSKLTIIEGILVFKTKNKQADQTISRISTKINPINDEVIDFQKVQQSNQQNEAFQVDENSEKLKCYCREIFIENSRINIYALKKLVKMTASNLTQLNDSSVFLKKNIQSNNKMLQELNFIILVKTFVLSQIELIEIKLKQIRIQENIYNENTNDRKRKRISQRDILVEEQKRSKLSAEYECDQNNEFVDFDLNIRPFLQNKYKKFKNQQELVDYIMNGSKSNEEDQIRQRIDENIIQDIQEHVSMFKKYIKNSLQKNILIIRQDCQEDPIAQNMIINVIIKNKNSINTIIFQDTGTIEQQSFIKITNSMFQIPNLQTIAFVSSQPKFDCYYLLKDLYQTKKFQYIIFHRSSFDFKKYEEIVLKKQIIKIDDYDSQNKEQTLFPNNSMNYYGFFILNSNQLYEFTPYSQQTIELFLNQKISLVTPQFQIENLFIKQQKYNEQIKDQINNIVPELILADKWILESTLSKYFKILTEKDKIQNEQEELQNDIKTLFKHFSTSSITTRNKLIDSIQDPIVIQSLKSESSSYKNGYQECQDFESLYFKFLIDQRLVMKNKDINCIIDNNFYSEISLTNQINVIKKEHNTSSSFANMISSIDKVLLNKKDNLKGLMLSIKQLQFKIFEITTTSTNTQKVYKQYNQLFYHNDYVKYEWASFQDPESYKNFYLSDKFNELLQNIVSKCTNIDGLQIELNYKLEKYFSEIFSKHMKIVEEKKIKLKWLILCNQNLNEIKLDPALIQNIKFKDFKEIKSEVFNGNTFGTIVLDKCSINQFENAHIKNLKKIIFEQMKIDNVQQIVQEIMKLKQNLSSSQKQLFVSMNLTHEIDLSMELMSSILNQIEIKFTLFDVTIKTQLYCNDIINGQMQKQLNHKELKNRLYGLTSKEDKKEVQIQNQQINTLNTVITINQISNDSNKLNNEHKYKTVFEELKNAYNQLPNHINLFFNFFNDQESRIIIRSLNNQDIQECVKHVSDCCKYNLLNNAQKQNLSITNELKKHTGDFCFYKTSLFQSRFHPRKIRIKFFENLLVNEYLIYDYKEIESITDLDFSESIFCDKSQTQFVNDIIQMSPNLETLKFKKIQVDDNAILKFQPLRSQKLKKLNLKMNSFEDILPIIDGFQTVTKLEYLNIAQICYSKQEDENVQFIIDQMYKKIAQYLIETNHATLKVLQITIADQNEFASIQKCIHLEKLVVYQHLINYYSGSFNSLMNTTLKQLTIFINKDFIFQNQQLVCIPLKQLQSILDHAKNFPNLQKIDFLFSKIGQTYFRKIDDQSKRQNQIIRVEKELVIDLESEDQLINFDQFISLFNQNIELFTYKSKNFFNSNSLSSLQELIIKDQPLKSCSFLNKIFEIAKNSLLIMILEDCQIVNSTLESVDFGKLPQTVQILGLSKNRKLHSLSFLEPVYNKIKDYNIKLLQLSITQIDFSQIIKYAFHIKQIEYNFLPAFSTKWYDQLIPLIEYLYHDKNLHYQVLHFFETAIIQVQNIDKQKIKLFYEIFFKQKIFHFQEQDIFPIILSPLSMVSSPIFSSDQLKRLLSKYSPFDSFTPQYSSLSSTIKNPYMLFCAFQDKERESYILGYSKKRYGSYFQLQDDQTLKSYMIETWIKSSQKNLKNFHLPLYLGGIDKKELSHLNSDQEGKIIQNLYQVPPCQLTIKDFSIQFIKTWYVINAISPLVFRTKIEWHDTNRICNSSIGNYLTQNLKRTNFLKSLLAGTPQKYRYDETVFFLAKYFDDQINHKKHIKVLLLFPLYVFVCIFGVVFFSLFFDVTCGHGISWYSYYSYIAFGCITFFIELKLFNICLNYISHLVPSLEISVNQDFISKILNSVKKFIIDAPWINQWYMGYQISFLKSQLARFDNFTNVAFLYSTYQCGDITTFKAAAVFISIPFLHALIEFLELVFRRTKKDKLPTHTLDIYYKICNIIEFKAVADIMDLVSPSNVTEIFGRMYNSRIISSFIRIAGESIPLIIIQIMNLFQRPINSTLIISLILSLITFSMLLLDFLTITPSQLEQEDFNKLNERKIKEKVIEKYEERLEQVEDEFFILRFYQHLKEINKQYLDEKKKNGQVSWKTLNTYNTYSSIIQKLFYTLKDQKKNEKEKEDDEIQEMMKQMNDIDNQVKQLNKEMTTIIKSNQKTIMK